MRFQIIGGDRHDPGRASRTAHDGQVAGLSQGFAEICIGHPLQLRAMQLEDRHQWPQLSGLVAASASTGTITTTSARPVAATTARSVPASATSRRVLSADGDQLEARSTSRSASAVHGADCGIRGRRIFGAPGSIAAIRVARQ